MNRLIYILLIIGIGFLHQCKEEKKDNSLLFGALAVAGSGTGGGGSGGTLETVATPTFSPTAGNQTSNGNIAISTTTSGATIYYTTDGTDPTTSSTQYSSALANIWSLAGKTIKAIAVKSGLTNSAVLSGIFSYPPLKTGSGAISGYTLVANEDNRTHGVNRGYTDNGNGTVTDNATGLVWQKCSNGLSGTNCETGTAATVNWTAAGTYCSGLSLASRTWRLPSRQELETLPDYSRSNPAIDTTAFPATVAGYYWSSTTYAPSTTDAWRVGFLDGLVFSGDKSGSRSVRCVSGQ
jgi:hypothetical protein